jgi:hypothetical protein
LTETTTRVEQPHELALQRAHKIVQAYDLKDVLAAHQQAIDAYMEARRQHAEARRIHQATVEELGSVELDALLEMEQNPDYVPGKNAEARKQQAEAWLAHHHDVKAAKARVSNARRVYDDADLAADHARARIDHLELQIAARRTELDLIASFARGAS